MIVGTDMLCFRIKAIIRALDVSILEVESGSGRSSHPSEVSTQLRSCVGIMGSVLESLQVQEPPGG